MKTLIAASVSAVALTALAAAAPASAKDVEIRNAVARVVVIPEDRTDIAVEIESGTADLPALQVRRIGNDVRIDGDLGRNDIRNCSGERAGATQPGDGASVEVRRRGRIELSAAPLVVIRTPRDVEVSAGSGVYGSIGRGASSIELGSGGCGGWTVANTSGRMRLAVGGSGSVRAGSSGRLSASVGGSGSIAAGATRDLEVAVGGSGSVNVARVDGTAEVSIGGSGDVVVRAGDTSRFEVAIGGSGDVNYGGTTRDLKVAIAGSGDVRVGAATGSVERAVVGSGTVVIGR